MTNKATVLMTRNHSAGQGDPLIPDVRLRHSTVRAVIHDNLRPIRRTLLLTVALTAAIGMLLPLINQAWMQMIRALIQWLQLDISVQSVINRVPYLAVTVLPPTPTDYLWHAAAALAVIAGARVALPAPFRATAMLVASIHFVATIVIALVPDAFPYSVADHTLWLSVFTVGLIIGLPSVMALTHAIIERDYEHRILGILLIWGFFIITLPVKLVTHAMLISSLSRLTTPTLFLVFGPAFDVFVLTALYAFIVTWRHNPGTT